MQWLKNWICIRLILPMCTYSSSPSKVRAFSTSVRRSRANFNGWQRRRSPIKTAVPAARRGCRRTAVQLDGLFCRHPDVRRRRRCAPQWDSPILLLVANYHVLQEIANLELDTDTSGHPTYRTLFCNKYLSTNLQICINI